MSNKHAVLSALLALGIVFFLFRDLGDYDALTHTATGLSFFHTGSLSPPFSFTLPESPFALGWLSAILFAAVYALANLSGLLFLGAVCLALSPLLVIAKLCDKAKVRVLPVVLSYFLVVLAMASNSDLRPQVFALLGFSLLLLLLRGNPTLKKVCWAFPLFLFWQNAHPSLSLAIVAIGSALLAALLRQRKEPQSKDRVLFLFFLLILSTLSQVFTPLGTSLFAVSQENVYISREVLGITEWLSPWDPKIFHAAEGFWLLFALTLVALYLNWRRIALEDFAIFLCFTGLSFFAVRFALFWSLTTIPILFPAAQRALPARFQGTLLNKRAQKRTVLLTFLCFAAAILLGRHALQNPLPSSYPSRALAALQEELSAGRIINYREWAGPLLITRPTQWQVVIDGRLYLYSETHWNHYEKIARGEIPLSEVEKRYHPDAFFLRKSYHRGLIPMLERASEWRMIYQDSLAIVFLKRK